MVFREISHIMELSKSFNFINIRKWKKVMFLVLPVCPFVCLSVGLSAQAITFEPLYIGTSFLVWRYILITSRPSLSIKVIGSRSRSCAKNWLFIYFNLLFHCMWLHVINKVKVKHQGKGHISRSRSNKVNFWGKVLLSGWFAFESDVFLF